MDTIDPNVTERKPSRPLWTSRRVCEYFGGVTPRSLHRWKTDPTLGFPQPTVINKRDYYDPQEIEDFALKRRAIADYIEAKKAAESKPAVEAQVVEAQPKIKPKKIKPTVAAKPAARPRGRPRKHAAASAADFEVTT
jgi:hypothetical protein